jgi:hypothetical protein
VALRVTLDAKLADIVKKATDRMKAVTDKALADVAALPTPSPRPSEHGKATEQPRKTDEHKDEQRGASGDHRPSFLPLPTFSPRTGRP